MTPYERYMSEMRAADRAKARVAETMRMVMEYSRYVESRLQPAEPLPHTGRTDA